jgi:oligopeptide transport system permease protein
MTRLVGSRLLQLPLILLIVYTITFTLVWLIPGNPLEKSDGRRPPQEIVEAMEAQYQLDNPVAFYVDYIYHASGVAWLAGDRDGPFFDLGPSLRHENWTVNEILASQLPVSMALGLAAILLALIIGVSAGIIGALKPGTLLDHCTFILVLVGISLPAFVTGTVLLVVFAVWMGWAPIGRWGGVEAMVLPTIALSLPFAAYIARLTRHGMIEQMGSPYIQAARAKGMPESVVVLRHALPNAFLPVLSYLGPAAAAAMTGSFVIEKVFAIPGVGTHFVDAVLGKDVTLITGIVLVYASMLVIFNLAVDMMYAWLDPRISLGGA